MFRNHREWVESPERRPSEFEIIEKFLFGSELVRRY